MGRTKGAKGKKNKAEIALEIVRKQECSPVNEHSQIVNNPLIEKNNIQISQERKDKLNQTLREINKIIPDSVKYAKDIEVKERQSFGYKCLDKLTGGGIIRGNFTTIWGSKACGKSTIAYKMIATAQKEGKIATYLDIERSYDPLWAAKFEVNVNDLVIVNIETAEQALDTIIKLCREDVIDLIVLDSIQGLTPKQENYAGKGEKERSVEDDSMALLARKLSQFFRMAAAPVSKAKCAILLIGQARMDLSSFIKLETLSGGHALLHNSRLILRCRRGQGADAPTEKKETGKITEKGKPEMKSVPIGFDCVIHVNKSQIQGCTEGDEIHVPFYYKDGIKE
jgi:protein RecA